MIGIIGLGWLGYPLAKRLQDSGFDVVGSTTSPEKKQKLEKEINHVILLDLNTIADSKQLDVLLDIKTLYINIPPSKTSNYLNAVKSLISICTNLEKIIFISSTSVYLSENKTVTEKSPIDDNNKIAEVEKYICELNIPFLILRYAGLTGPERNLAKYFSGKLNVTSPNTPVNLIHLQDAVNVSFKSISENWQGIYNVCTPEHPTRINFYSNLCTKMKIQQPIFDLNSTENWKIIGVDKLINEKNYQFLFPDPIDFTY